MSHFSISDTAIDLKTGLAVVSIGGWFDSEAFGRGVKPANVRYLHHKPEMQGEAIYGAVIDLANAHDWSTTLADCSYVVGADDALTPMPAQPSPHHAWDWATKQWQDPRTMQDLKDAKWAAIKQARDAAEFSTFTYNDMVFDGDLDAQRRLASYISVSKSAIAAGQPFSADFTLADNSLVTLSAQDFVGIELAKVQAVAAAFSHGAMLRNQIELATVVAELTSIAW